MTVPIKNVITWNRLFEEYSDLIFQGRSSDDVLKGANEGRTAIIFGFQNCSPIEDNIGLVEICHQLGVRFMHLFWDTDNWQPLCKQCHSAKTAREKNNDI